MSKSKKKILFRWFNNLVTAILFVVLIGMLIVVISTKASGGDPELFGYQLKTVLSGSMEPEFKTGSIIAVKPGGDTTRFKENDVITFMEEDGKLITHRIIEVIHSGENVMYRTKGDNNNGPDMNPVLSENVVAEYTGFSIPYAGYIVDSAQSKNGAFLLLIPGVLLLCYSIFTIWRALSELDRANKRKNNQLDQDSQSISS